MLKMRWHFGYLIFFLYLCNMKKILYASVLPIFNYGVRINGVRIDNEINPFALSTALSTDVHKPNDNIVMKLTNTNPPYESIKFTDCKKLK